MSEIEKAKRAIDDGAERLLCTAGVDVSGPTSRYSLTTAIEALIDEKLAEHADRIRAIAREEIEAAGPWVCGACGAVPSPTCPHRGVIPQCGVLVRATDNQEGGEANSRLDHTGLHESPPAVEAPAAGAVQRGKVIVEYDAPGITALARRLAEALRNQHESAYPDQAMTEQALDEARKAGLIE